MGIVISWLGIIPLLKAETTGEKFVEAVSQLQQNPPVNKQVVQVSPSGPEAPQPSTVPPSRPAPPAATPPMRPTPRKTSPVPVLQPPAPAATQPPTVGPPTPPPTTPSPQVTPPVTPTRASVVFNFDNADIYEVIRVMAEILKINYIIDPKVKGIVNIHTSGQISAEDVFPIFQSILRLNGATAVKKDGVYEIVPLADAKKLSIPPSTTRESGKSPSGERYTIVILHFAFVIL